MIDLKPQYQAYAHAILAGETETQAAITAGYGKKNAHQQGSRLSRNVEIKAYIEARQAKAAAIVEFGMAEVRAGWKKLVEFGLQELQVRDREGEVIPDLFSLMDARAAQAALNEFAKTLNMYEEHNNRTLIIEEVRRLAREVGADEDAAVEEAERWLATQK